jgi:hypothetical protein
VETYRLFYLPVTSPIFAGPFQIRPLVIYLWRQKCSKLVQSCWTLVCVLTPRELIQNWWWASRRYRQRPLGQSAKFFFFFSFCVTTRFCYGCVELPSPSSWVIESILIPWRGWTNGQGRTEERTIRTTNRQIKPHASPLRRESANHRAWPFKRKTKDRKVGIDSREILLPLNTDLVGVSTEQLRQSVRPPFHARQFILKNRFLFLGHWKESVSR